MSHTATPWAIDPHSDAETIAIHSPEADEHICIIQGQGKDGSCTERDKDNAAFIRLACNCHEELLEACRLMDWSCIGLTSQRPTNPVSAVLWGQLKDAAEHARAALAKAKGGAS